ncbi:hypothetical protein SRCM100623_02900 [Acetobacter pasteurianus]|uniref:Uncharacterized protein n=1 Tax=Acetobacter pasteurianus TaxID=438 RepID=A0A0S3JPX3_ACEPA|nr:hypothetical protein DB34_15000 [Acetobacter pasteurianus]OAZ60032.1 hypothetical protein SRCM100623_02900 [Acetobacter pasteurianus]
MDRHTPSSQSGASSRQADLFGYRKPRAPRRYLAHMSDVGDHGCIYEPGNTCVALFSCARCGWESGWLERRNKTHVLQGVPCMKCNDKCNDQAKGSLAD